MPQRRDALRRLFIPRLARIDRESKAPQRRIARQSELPADLLPLARALTQRRLLVVKLAGQAEGAPAAEAATLEVAHEALLRRWPTLADLLAEDRDALLLLDGVLSAAADWDKAEAARKPDFLAHRGSRLADAQALAARGPDWARAIAPALPLSCRLPDPRDDRPRGKEAALAREQEQVARAKKLQRRVGWALAMIAVLVVVELTGVYWQHAANIEFRHPSAHNNGNSVRRGLIWQPRRRRTNAGRRNSIRRKLISNRTSGEQAPAGAARSCAGRLGR